MQGSRPICWGFLEPFKDVITLPGWCFVAYCLCLDAVFTVELGNMLGMLYVDSIYDPLLVLGVSEYSVAQPLQRRTYVKLLGHFPHGEVAIGTTSVQSVDNLHVGTAGPYRHIVI